MSHDATSDAIRARVNEIIRYHSPITEVLNKERTSLESRLIPVTAYIVIACGEAFLRYPELARRIGSAMPAEEIGRRARVPGCQVDTCYLWSIANFALLGRKLMATLDPGRDSPQHLFPILDFWDRAARAYRGDGTRQAWDTGSATPYGSGVVATLLADVAEITDANDRHDLSRLSATLVNLLFLLYFDCRAGYGDTGPYEVPGRPDRTLLVRYFYRIGPSYLSWSDVSADVGYTNLTAAYVLEGGSFRITDFGTSIHTPEPYLDRLVGFGLYTSDGCDPGELRPVPHDEFDAIASAVRTAQATLYRRIAGMDRMDKIRCGAYVYFTFLRPFAELAGIADDLDWTVPRDLPEPAVQMLSMLDGADAAPPPDERAFYEEYP
ncbi:MAG: hypothetical protein ACRD0G_15305 [Acidimicrobiales bacterium]